jgi:hypothetical protein
MGVPSSEVGYSSATTRRETTKSIRNMWWYWKEKKFRMWLSEVYTPSVFRAELNTAGRSMVTVFMPLTPY